MSFVNFPRGACYQVFCKCFEHDIFSRQNILENIYSLDAYWQIVLLFYFSLFSMPLWCSLLLLNEYPLFLEHNTNFSSPFLTHSTTFTASSWLSIKMHLLSTEGFAHKIAQKQKQSKCPSTNGWLSKMWYIHTMQYYLVIKKDKLVIYATSMDLKH